MPRPRISAPQGQRRITRRLTKAATGLRGLEALAADAAQAAQAQTVTIPGAQLRAEIIADIAARRWPPATGSRPPITRSGSGSPTTLIRPSSCRCRGWGPRSPPNSSRWSAASTASTAPTRWPPPQASPRCCRQSGKTQLPAPRSRWRQGPQARLLSGSLHLSRTTRQPRLLRPQACRGQTPPPGRHRPRKKTRERALGILHKRQPFRENFKMAA